MVEGARGQSLPRGYLGITPDETRPLIWPGGRIARWNILAQHLHANGIRYTRYFLVLKHIIHHFWTSLVSDKSDWPVAVHRRRPVYKYGTWHLIFFSILIYNFVCAIYIYRLDQKQVTVRSFAWFLWPKLKYAYIHNNWVYPIPFARRCCASMFRCAIHPSGPACVRPRWLITRNVLQASSGEGLTPHTFHHYLFGPLQAPSPLPFEGYRMNLFILSECWS